MSELFFSIDHGRGRGQHESRVSGVHGAATKNEHNVDVTAHENNSTSRLVFFSSACFCFFLLLFVFFVLACALALAVGIGIDIYIYIGIAIRRWHLVLALAVDSDIGIYIYVGIDIRRWD